MIRFSCDCGRQLVAGAENIGRLAACPMCGKTFTVPVLVFAYRAIQEEGVKAKDAANLKAIARALQDHNNTYGYCPAATAYYTKDGKPGFSWRVAILPFLGQDRLLELTLTVETL